MAMPQHIAIVGAGLIGRLLAWKLLQQGAPVTLLERGSRAGEGSAARVAAAMLAPYTEVVHAERAVFDWGREALSWWPQALVELERHSGVSVPIALSGSIAVAHQQDRSSMQQLRQALQSAVPDHMDKVEALDRRGLAELEPALAEHFDSGLYLREEGYLDNRVLLHALDAAIEKLGGQWRDHCEVEAIAPGCITVNGDRLNVAKVIDCRGIGAKNDIAKLRGVRGEVLWVRAPEVSLSRPVRLMHPRYKLYISPRADHRYVIGATEIESESMAPVTVRSSLELLSALYTVHSGFAEATVEESLVHCRPAMPDNLPLVVDEPGLMRVNGLHRHGYLLGPKVVEEALGKLGSGHEWRT